MVGCLLIVLSPTELQRSYQPYRSSSRIQDPTTALAAKKHTAGTAGTCNHCGSASLENKLYAMGGVDPDGDALTSMEVYDPSANTWTAGKGMSTPRNNFGLASLGNKLYAVGGGTATTT